MINCGNTNHKELLTWDEYKKKPIPWIANHPTLCFRKSKILEIGNYNKNLRSNEDFELELKILKKFGKIYTIKETLLYYRLHNEQWTACNEFKRPEVVEFRNNFIKEMIENEDVQSTKVYSKEQTINNIMPKIENNSFKNPLSEIFTNNKSVKFKLVYQ